MDTCAADRISGWIRPPDGAEAVAITLEQPDSPPVALQIGGLRPVPPGSRHVALPGASDVVAARLLAGNARICLRWSDAEGVRHEATAALGPRFRATALAHLEARLARAAQADAPIPPRAIWDRIVALPFKDVTAETPTSRFDMIEGLVSRDESTIIGKDGFLFLYQGNNQLLEQYEPSAQDASNAAHWTELIANRRRLINATGASFLQVLIPEKTSVLSHLLPFEIKAPTPLSARLRANMAADGGHDFLDLASLMQGEAAAEWWRRTDSHLSTAGCLRAFQAILDRMGVEAPDIPLSRRTLIQGDLGARFPGIVDISLDPEEVDVFASRPDISIHTPRPGSNGTEVISHNPDAPIASTVLVFGNSFFAQPTGPQYLSWWFSRWFRDYHFHWNGNLDMEAVERIQPDHVICQTIERFLFVLPKR